MFHEDFTVVKEEEKVEPVIVVQLVETTLFPGEDLYEIEMCEDLEGATKRFQKALISKANRLASKMQAAVAHATMDKERGH